MFKAIETPRCRIRFFREADLSRFTAYRADPEVARYQGWSAYTYDDALALYADLQAKPFAQQGQWYQLALADSATDELVGDLALHFIEPGLAEIGFTVSPACQGRGIASEALAGLLRYLFEGLEYTRVIAITDVQNLPSIGVLESAGFQREGAPRRVIFKGGAGEEYDYALSRAQWRLPPNAD